MARILGIIGVMLGALYLSACGLLYSQQRKLVFPAPDEARTPSVSGATLETLSTERGPVYALYAPGDPLVVLFHGNAEQLADEGWEFDRLRGAGLGVLAVEYPGYGLAHDQVASESAILFAADAAVQHFARDPARTVLWGRSLGTGVAMQLAARGRAARVVLLSPYTSIADLGAAQFPWLPVRLLARDPFDSALAARSVPVPVLAAHGDRDAVIPFANGRALLAGVRAGHFVGVAGAGHNDLLEKGGEALWNCLLSFARTGAMSC